MASDLPYWSQVPVQSRDCTVIMHWGKSWLEPQSPGTLIMAYPSEESFKRLWRLFEGLSNL